MLGRFRTFLIAGAAVALAGLGMTAPQSSAHFDPNNPACAIVAQNATVSNVTHGGGGLYYPVTDPGILQHPGGDQFTWTFSGTCNNNGASFSSSGTGVGWCGRSVGVGSGTITRAGVTHTYTVNWQSAASQLILTHGSALGSVNANPLLTQGSCTNGTATQFTVDGGLAHLT